MKIYNTGLSDMQQARVLIDEDLKRFIDGWRATFDQGSADGLEAYCQIVLRGGKRLRGILAMQSYYAHGGTDDIVAIGVARVLELVQAYLLVLDDIFDRSDTRRGGPSAHRIVQSAAVRKKMRGDTAHYGEAQVVSAAQSGAHIAALELLRLPVADAAIRRALMSLHKNIEITGKGQMNDIYNEATNEQLNEAAIERVLTQKSAYYTFVNPLELGACLAGCEMLDVNLHQYALHTGCAFQITDDLIGTFGATTETGKSTNDDIREGKMTLIAQYALAHANEADQQMLRSILGNVTASDEECDEARRIMLATGAREYAIERAHSYATKARQALANQTSLDPEFLSFLGQLIDYVRTRQA
ncbi:MAG TPA: polyprenyl synthetase family protein [Candidatus Saccharimonadales bacterium]|jgi:geranylgeranyl diphosphate synthase type I|nr:polyprenyl synthetase family protein [Candidatus Saccharimonadales bacterium]